MRRLFGSACFLARTGAIPLVAAACLTAPATHAQITRADLTVQSGHAGVVSTIAFSPDSRLLASGGADRSISLWDVESATQIRTLTGHTSKVVSVTFDRDGKRLATSGDKDGIILWDVAQGRQLKTITPVAGALTFSADGRYLVGVRTDNSIGLWDPGTGAMVTTFKGHTKPAVSLAFSPNGRMLVSGGMDGTVRFWEFPSGAPLRAITTPSANVTSVAISPDGTTVASLGVSQDALVLWDVASGQMLRSINENASWMNVLAFSTTGNLLASGSRNDVAINFWSAHTGTKLHTLKSGESQAELPLSLAFSPDGRWFASASPASRIRLCDAATLTRCRDLRGTVSKATMVAISPSGTHLGISGEAGLSNLWDVNRSGDVSSLSMPAAARSVGSDMQTMGSLLTFMFSDSVPTLFANPVAFSPDSQSLATTALNAISIWDVASRRQKASWPADLNVIIALAFSPQGQLLATSSERVVQLWDVAERKMWRTLPAEAIVQAIQFSPDGDLLAGGDWDGRVTLWGVRDPSIRRTLEGHESKVNTLAFSPNGRWLATGSGVVSLMPAAEDNSARVWDASRGQLLDAIPAAAPVVGVAFDANGERLAIASEDRRIRIWDTNARRIVTTLEGLADPITSVAFGPDPNLLFGAAGNSKITVWSIREKKLLATLLSMEGGDWLVATPDSLFDGSTAAWRKASWLFDNDTFKTAPVEALFSEYFYPGLLPDLLNGRRPQAPQKLGRKDLRLPKVALERLDANTSPATGTDRSMTVRVLVGEAPADRTRGLRAGEVWDVRLFRNGTRVKVWPGNALEGKNGCRPTGAGRAECIATVPVVSGANTFTAYAFNRDNVKSVDAELTSVSNVGPRKGTLHVVAVGINRYSNPSFNLQYAVDDARAITEELTKRQVALGSYADTSVTLITDEEATKPNVLFALERLSRGAEASAPKGVPSRLAQIPQARPEDAVLVFFAGHGVAEGERFLLVGYDGWRKNRERAHRGGSVTDRDLETALAGIDAQNLAIIIDACQSAQALQSPESRRGPMNSKGLAQLAYEKGIYILTAAEPDQDAIESQNLRHGVLTHFLLEGLKSRAADRDKNDVLSEREWMEYAAQEVPRFLDTQHPRLFYRRESSGPSLIVSRP